jgi:hypothetical protein
MLDVKSAKTFIDFGKQLQPPPGFEIDYAVATTYTLDLYALLSIPLAMYYKQALDVEVTEDNFQILEAIQNLQKHLKIYCHYGKIAVPKSSSIRLLSFIENCVIQVAPKTPFESFHPKVWVLRFKSIETKEIVYRVIVMSRNLTFDRSYDIAYWMEGKPSGGPKPENDELVSFLIKLDKYSPFQHKKFISDLAKVEFELSDHFSSYEFSSFPKKESRQSIDLDTVYKKRMVVSPFLSSGMVNKLNDKTQQKLIVFSRKEELDKLPITLTDSLDAYFFSQEIVNHHLYENADDGEDDQYDTHDWNNNLHAKIYLRENTGETLWDLGSANCSDAAFDRNHEFLLHLRSSLYVASICKVKEALLSEYNGIKVFKKYVRSFDLGTVATEEDFRQLEFDLIHSLENIKSFKAKVEPHNKNYNLSIELELAGKLLDAEYTLFCKPLGLKVSFQEVKSCIPVVFEDIPLYKLSSFIHWQVRFNSSPVSDLVTKANVSGMPEARLSNILKSIIDNPDKFMALILALLTDEPMGGFNNAESKSLAGGPFIANPFSYHLDMPIYEELLISLSRSPERLTRLSSLIEKLNASGENQIVPKEFSNIWKTIKEILPK